MFPDLIRIGPIPVHSFGVMAMLGFLIPSIILRSEFRRLKIDPDFASTVAVAAIIGGFVGARAYYIFERWPDFLKDPLSMIFSGAGLVWYGGFAGGAVAVTFVIKRHNLPFLPTIDLIGPLLLLGYVFGRGGCFLAGDGDYGPPSDVPWAMAFPKGYVPTEVPVHPTPLYDIALSLIFFAVIWKLRTRTYPAGTIFGVYLIAAGSERFITEFWRNTARVAFGWMSVAQIISIVLVLGGTFLINWAAKRPAGYAVRNIDSRVAKTK